MLQQGFTAVKKKEFNINWLSCKLAYQVTCPKRTLVFLQIFSAICKGAIKLS